MSIINTNQPSQPTKQQLIKSAKRINDIKINGLFNQMKNVYNDVFDSVWNSSDYTPQDIFNEYSINGGELFRLAGILFSAANTAVSGAITKVPQITYSIDGSGIVTISS